MELNFNGKNLFELIHSSWSGPKNKIFKIYFIYIIILNNLIIINFHIQLKSMNYYFKIVTLYCIINLSYGFLKILNIITFNLFSFSPF